MTRVDGTSAPHGRLLLVRHSITVPDPTVPSAEWRLSEEGSRRCAVLATRLCPYGPRHLACSPEPKARETAELLGASLELVPAACPGLREADRTGVPLFRCPDEFELAVATFFARPSERALGEESAQQAETRFCAALAAIHSRVGPTPWIAVAHATVMSLLLARVTGRDAIGLWRELGMPALAVLDIVADAGEPFAVSGGLRLVELVAEIGGGETGPSP